MSAIDGLGIRSLPPRPVEPKPARAKPQPPAAPAPVNVPATQQPASMGSAVGHALESAASEGGVLAKLKTTPFVSLKPIPLAPNGTVGTTPRHDAPPVDQKKAAAESQVSVDAKQAQGERETAAQSVKDDAQKVRDEATHIQREVVPGPADPDCKITVGMKDGKPYTQETHYGKDGKPDRVITVVQDPNGNVSISTEAVGKLRNQSVTQKDGKTAVDDSTLDLTTFPPGPVATRHAVTDGTTTTVSSQVTKGGKTTGTEDTWTTEKGTKGIRGEVDEGFDPNASTEVHHHKTLTGSDDGISYSDTTTYSQGNHRVSRNATSTFPDGDSQVSWTQEEQVGNDYRAQTTIEGHPDVLIQVHRHADPTTGTVTEDTVRSNPINGEVQQQSHVDRAYDDQGRLTHQKETVEDKDGNKKSNDYSATYSTNPDGTTSVLEHTVAEVDPKDGPNRVTTQDVHATDTKDGREVTGVHTTVDVGGQRALEADGDGDGYTIQAHGQTLHFDADGKPDAATAKLVTQHPELLADGLMGLNAVQQGATSAATGTKLTGPFADHQKAFQTNLAKAAALFKFEIEDSDIDDALKIVGEMAALGNGTDAANAEGNILTSDVVRYVMEGKQLGIDAWNLNKTVKGASQAAKDAEAAAEEVGKLGRAFAVGGIVAGLITGGFDTYKLFTAQNGLDRADAGLSATGSFATAGIAIAALAEGGPPGWVAAAAALAIQAVVTEGHNIIDDERRGHPGEATAETLTSILGTPIAGILLHAWFKHEDADELRTHPLNGSLPHL